MATSSWSKRTSCGRRYLPGIVRVWLSERVRAAKAAEIPGAYEAIAQPPGGVSATGARDVTFRRQNAHILRGLHSCL